MTGHRGAAALTKLGPGGEFAQQKFCFFCFCLNSYLEHSPFSVRSFFLTHHHNPSLFSTYSIVIGLRDMGIALVLGIVGATAWSQVAHANRRDWEQANRVSA
jgi:hypothetical protein